MNSQLILSQLDKIICANTSWGDMYSRARKYKLIEQIIIMYDLSFNLCSSYFSELEYIVDYIADKLNIEQSEVESVINQQLNSEVNINEFNIEFDSYIIDDKSEREEFILELMSKNMDYAIAQYNEYPVISYFDDEFINQFKSYIIKNKSEINNDLYNEMISDIESV